MQRKFGLTSTIKFARARCSLKKAPQELLLQRERILYAKFLANPTVYKVDEGRPARPRSTRGRSSANGPAGIQLTNTIRGENVMQTLGNQQSASYRAGIANGGSVQAQLTYPTPGQPSSAWHNPVIEPINAVVTSWSKEVYVQNSDPDAPQHTIDCGPQVKTQNYDAASRLGSRTVSMTVTSTAPD